MTTNNDGGPAFPFPSGPEPRVNQFHDRCEGMSLRDYFAAKAMPLAHDSFSRLQDGTHEDDKVDYSPDGICDKDGIPIDAGIVAEYAYAIADAMLAERAKNGGAQ